MKKIVPLCLIFLITTTSTYGISSLDVGEVNTRITSLQADVPASLPTVASGYDRKGYVGSILANIFTTTQKIKSDFILAFRDILSSTYQNNIPKWNGQIFKPGTLWDVGGNIGVGTSTLSSGLRLDVAGKIGATEYCDENGMNCIVAASLVSGGSSGGSSYLWDQTGSVLYTGNNVGIGTSTPSVELHNTGIARFDGGVQVDGLRAISSTNMSHNAQATTDSRYGYFEVTNDSGARGAYLGYGNGGNRVRLHIDAADRMNISGGNVGIGINDPQALLHVNGNIIANNPTANNHVATKSYVDGMSGGSSGGGGGPDAYIVDQKASGVNGQTQGSGWNTKHLNTEKFDLGNVISINSNNFTVTHNGVVEWNSPGTTSSRSRLYNVTDSIVVDYGSTVGPGHAATVNSSQGMASVEAGKTYRIENISLHTTHPAGTGYAAFGIPEIYTTVKYWASGATGVTVGDVFTSKYGSGNRCVNDDWIGACGYAPGSPWNYNVCYGRGHTETYGWSLVWNSVDGGYNGAGSAAVGSQYDVICAAQ